MSSNKKRIMIVLIISIFIVIIPVIIIIVNFIKHEKMQIPDTNGESKELCKLTDEFVTKEIQYYYAVKYKVRTKGSAGSGVKGHFEEHDHDYVHTTIGKLSGAYVANAYLGNEKPITFKIDSTVKNGNCAIYILNEDGVILDRPSIDCKTESTVDTENGKEYYVVFAAESAEIDFTVERVYE